MNVVTLIALLAGIATILEVILQAISYLQKRSEQKTPKSLTSPLTSRGVIPNNLPARGEFIGRRREIARVQEALVSRLSLTCIDGIGGIGKTALALEVAGECLRASTGEIVADGVPVFDGFIWTTAKGRDLTLNHVLDIIARTLNYPGIAQQPTEEKRESVRKLMQGKRYLLIVDNFETVADDAMQDFLLQMPEPSKALITSREQKLHQAWAVSLKPLEQEEALDLIRSEGRRLGLVSLEKGKEQVLLHLCEATGGAPLAIKWAVGQIKQKGQSLDAVLVALREARGDMFEDIFARSWSLISQDARRILMAMTIFATSASWPAIEAASDVHQYALDEALGQLVEMWLVEATAELKSEKRRYGIHPLTRSFASAAFAQQPEFDRDAHLRLIHYYTGLAEKCGGIGWDWHSFDLLEPEKDNIMALLSWCNEQGMWEAILDIKDTMWNFLHIRGYWHDSLHCGLLAVKASRKLANQESLAWHLVFGAGWTYLHQGYFDKAEEMAREALQISERCGYHKSKALALGNLGMIARVRGDLEESKELYSRSRKIWLCLGEQKWATIALVGLGVTAFRSKEYDQAQSLFELALEENRKLRNDEGIATALTWLGNTAREREDFRLARDLYQESLEVQMCLNRPLGIAYSMSQLARLSAREGDVDMALKLGREAREVFQRLGLGRDLEEIDALLEAIKEQTSLQE
jgi:tetratricopeptide (TPR) repeat protein